MRRSGGSFSQGVDICLSEALHCHDHGVQDDAHHNGRVEPLMVHKTVAHISHGIAGQRDALQWPQALRHVLRLDPGLLFLSHQHSISFRL